jgi:hypothetical protein
MAEITPGTQFIGMAPGLDLKERRSASNNSKTEVYTIEDIAAAAGGSDYTETIVQLSSADVESGSTITLPVLPDSNSYYEGFVLVELDNSPTYFYPTSAVLHSDAGYSDAGSNLGGSYYYLPDFMVPGISLTDLKVGCGIYADFGSGLELRRVQSISKVSAGAAFYPNALKITVSNQPLVGSNVFDPYLGTVQVFGIGVEDSLNAYTDFEGIQLGLSFDTPRVGYRYNFSCIDNTLTTYSNGNGFPSGLVTMKFYLKTITFGA